LRTIFDPALGGPALPQRLHGHPRGLDAQMKLDCGRGRSVHDAEFEDQPMRFVQRIRQLGQPASPLDRWNGWYAEHISPPGTKAV
jgi:hypothetical protein